MATFPKSESEILTLAQELQNGLLNNSTLYPDPPVGSDDLVSKINAYTAKRDLMVTVHAQAEETTTQKDEALEALVDAMKSDLSYAENTVDDDDDKLKLLGWGGRKAPSKLTVPGQPRNLEIDAEGAGIITLDWKKPASKSGGKPQSYVVQCRQFIDAANPGDWEIKGMALTTEATLAGLPQRVHLEFRVLAVNKAGESLPSNSVAAML